MEDEPTHRAVRRMRDRLRGEPAQLARASRAKRAVRARLPLLDIRWSLLYCPSCWYAAQRGGHCRMHG